MHRDVSPQNVFVTYEGGVKLLDFGIAKAENRGAAATRVGQLKGKIRYMSPEQSRAFPLDRRSDIFSAGILLWELTTGRRLYRGTSDFDVLKAIIEGDAPPPSSVKPDYPKALERIVMRALRRNRAERYQTAQEMQLALEDFARERRLPVSPVALSNYVRHVCAERVAAWEQAMATRSGLVDHIAGTMGMSISETPWLENSLDLIDGTAAATVAEPSPPMSTAPVNLRPSARRWWIVGGITTAALAAAIGIVARPALKPAEPPKIEMSLQPPPKVEPAPVVAPVPAPKAEVVAPKPTPEVQPPPPKPAVKAAEPRPKPQKKVVKPKQPPVKKRVDLDSPLPP